MLFNISIQGFTLKSIHFTAAYLVFVDYFKLRTVVTGWANGYAYFYKR